MTVAELDIPTALPIANFSLSSAKLLMMCPEKFRRRYVLNEYEPPSGAMILGSAVGAAEGHADQQLIDYGERPSTDDVIDLFTDEFDERTEREEVKWGSESPGEIKDTGVKAVKVYERDVVPHIKPVSVEREFTLDLEGVDWGFRGFLDLEEADGTVVDRKVRKRKLSRAEADEDLQPTSYLLARRAEGKPAPVFKFHTMVKTQTPYAEVVPTVRTDVQLDRFVDRLYGLGRELHWRMENDEWSFAAPGSWLCKVCGYKPTCPVWMR